MKLLKKINTMLSKYFYDLFHYGIKVAHYSLLGEFVDFNIIKGNKANKIYKNREESIYNFLIKKYSSLINEYKNKNIKVKDGKKIIWCLWWQGIENAPLLVQKCIKSIEKNKGDYEFVLLTKDNYDKYANIPHLILKQLDNKIISITHFSDILRSRLLSTHGGIWVDATMYFNENVFKNFDNKVFNSCSLDQNDIECDYTCFFMGGKPNKLFMFLYDFLIENRKHYKTNISYFMIDYIILIAYRNFDDCRRYIDEVTIKNKDIFKLNKIFNNIYDEDKYNSLLKNAKFFKLSYKKKYTEYEFNKITNYGYFIKKD